MRPFIVLVLTGMVCNVLGAGLPAFAQPRVELRADFNTGPNASPQGGISNFSSGVAFDGRYLFTMRTAEHGNELWESDGTVSGTRRLTDLCPGGCDGLGSDPQFQVLGTRLLFSAADGRHGFEPWALQAGSDVPSMVADVNPGATGSSPTEFRRISFSISGSLVTRDFFVATRTDVGRELWRLQGDAVALEIDLMPGQTSSTPASLQLCSTGHVCVTAVQAAGVREVRRLLYSSTTGPSTATAGVGGLSLGAGREVVQVVGFGPTTYLIVRDSTQALFELHAFGASADATTLLDTAPLSTGLSALTPNSALFRMFYVRGSQLKVSDATVAGTQVLASTSPQSLLSLGNRLLYTATTAGLGRELHASDGSVAGTGLLRELVPGSAGLPSSAFDLGMLPSGSGTRVYLAFPDASQSNRARVWISDGTSGGTLDAAGNALTQSGHLRLLASLGTSALFGHGPGSTSQSEPWVTAGTQASTVQLGSFRSVVGDGHPFVTGAFGTRAYVSAFNGTPQREFQLDVLGNGAPTASVEVAFPIGERLGRLWYLGVDDELTVGDGSAEAGVHLGVPPLSDTPGCYVERNGFVYFLTTTDGNSLGDVEIARSDGTAAGTAVVTDLSLPGTRRVDPFCFAGRTQLAVVGERLVFVAASADSGFELFALDATDTATLVRDIRVGTVSSQPRELLTLRGRPGLPDVAVFHADDGVFGVELWASDGTGQGTVRLTDIEPSIGSSAPQDFVHAGDRVYFTAVSSAHGRELYVSDGTVAGTRQVIDLFAGSGSAFGSSEFHRPLAFSGERLYFSAASTADPTCAVFETDGTADGTRCAYDAAAHNLRAVGREAVVLDSGALVFSAHRSAPIDDGHELRLLLGGQLIDIAGGDIVPGSGSSNPILPRRVGDSVWFSARREDVGQELFRLDVGDLSRLFGDGFEP